MFQALIFHLSELFRFIYVVFLIEISKLLGLTKHISIAFYALLISFTFVQHQAIHDCTSSMLAACYHSSQKEAAFWELW